MPDLEKRLRVLDRLEPPDLWGDIRTRETSRLPKPRPPNRWVPIAVAAAVTALGIGLVARAFLGDSRVAQPGRPTPSAEMSASIVANGEVWFQRLGGKSGTWIEAVDPDGTNRRVLFSDTYAGGVDEVGRAYDWSPDGSQVAFIDDTGYIGEVPTGESVDVFVMNADGTGRRQVTDDGGFDAAPSWSADGTRLVYASDRSDPDRPACEMDVSCNVDIFVVNVDGTGQVQLTSEPGLDWQPDWGPDGRVVFVSDRDDPAGDIYVMNSDGTGIARLTATPEQESQPRWSPDGTRIAFVRDEGGSFGLYVMDADSTDAQMLAGGLPTSHQAEPDVFDDFVWSPDGTMIAFVGGGVSGSTLSVIGADGSGLRRLVEDETALSSPAWRPRPAPFNSDFMSPAPRDCRTGIRGVQLIPSQAVRLMQGHVPTALPPGFGVQAALESFGGTQIVWTDGRCRMVRVSFAPSEDPVTFSGIVDRVGPWVVEYDKPRACGNSVMGMGRCTGYGVGVRDGVVLVQTIGLSREEADAMVRSIPL